MPNADRITIEWIADLLFPRACVGCDREGSFLCDACQSTIPKKMTHRCPFCRKVDTPYGATCLACAKRHELDGIFAAAPFQGNPVVEEAIHVLKYEFVTELARPLGALLAHATATTDLPLPDFLVPVPLHPWRRRFRGFNQATLIARVLAQNMTPGLSVPIRDDILARTRFTLSQARSKNAAERRRNLSGAFSLDKKHGSCKQIKRKTVWLVDDVATTGTTLEECARVLKRHGAKKVFGIVIAR